MRDRGEKGKGEMTVECPSLSRFARFHDSCVRRIESDPVRFNPQLLEFAAARLRELIGSSDLAMRVRSWDLEKIVKDDRIKQMMELGRGTTLGGPEARRTVVEALFDADVNSLGPRDYPKYGYLGCPDKRADFFGNPDFTHHYGSVIVTLKRENLLSRTTIVFGNSVNFGAFRYKVPTWLSAPHPVCLAGLSHHGAEDIPPSADPALMIKAFAILCASGKLSARTLPTMDELFEGRPGCEFFELQYHGELVFSRDVQSIDLMPWGEEPPDEGLLDRIRAMGVAVRMPCNERECQGGFGRVGG